MLALVSRSFLKLPSVLFLNLRTSSLAESPPPFLTCFISCDPVGKSRKIPLTVQYIIADYSEATQTGGDAYSTILSDV